MHILILQHARVETAGSLGQFLKEDGHTSEVVHLDEGEKLPENSNFDGLWVLGGPMDVWEEEIYPWLKEEKAFIKYLRYFKLFRKLELKINPEPV